MWLTRDWNHLDYYYGRGYGRIDNSPGELMHYRKRYGQFVDEAMRPKKSNEMRGRAVTHSGCTADILYKICTILEQITSQKSFKLVLEPVPEKAKHQSLSEAGESKTETAPTPDEVKEQKSSKIRGVNTELCMTLDEVVTKNLLERSDDDTGFDSMGVKAHIQISLEIKNGPDCALDGVEVPVSLEVSNSHTELGSSSGEANVEVVTLVKSPPSTLSSGSPLPSVFSKSSSKSSRSSTCRSNANRATTPPSSASAGSNPNGNPEMAAIEEEKAHESAVTTSDAPKAWSHICRDHVVPDARGSFMKSTSSRLASVFRKVSKSVQSAFDQQSNVTLMTCGPTGLAPVVTVDTTKINTVNHRTSNLAPVELNSQITAIQAPSQTDVSKSLLSADITLAEATHQFTDEETVKTDSCEQSALDTDQLGLSIVEADIPCTNAQDDMSKERKPSLEMTTITRENSSTCNSSEKLPVADKLQPHGKPKTNFGRGVLKKLALSRQTLALHLPVFLRKEKIANKGTKVSRPNKKKSVACWANKTLRKTYKNASSSTSLTGAPTASNFKEASDQPKEDTTQDLVIEENTGDIPSEAGASITATNIFDLQDLEPVDEDRLWDEGFTAGQIMVDLAQGKLDEARMQRLKVGFYALLDPVS